jgi:hypothetical protein
VQDDPDRDAFRESRGLSNDVASCHTAVVDRYVVEGHVPVEAIRRLLDQQPDAVGLALPGMPADSPGMGGDAESWPRQPVMLVNTDGTVTPWDY